MAETDLTWHFRVEHTANSDRLRRAAIDRMHEVQQAEGGVGVSVVHEPNEEAGIDSVTVTAFGQKVLVVVGFHPNKVLIAIKAAPWLQVFKAPIETRVREEIHTAVRSAGGEVISVSEKLA